MDPIFFIGIAIVIAAAAVWLIFGALRWRRTVQSGTPDGGSRARAARRRGREGAEGDPPAG